MYTEHLRIPVGAGSLHAERVGRGGHPVVLLHGFGTCSFLWRALAPRLADHGYTAIALDLLGHGESDRPLDMSFGLAAQAEYVERALTALRLPAVSLIGQDSSHVVVIDPVADRAQLAEPALRQLEALGVPHLIFVNKIDQARGRIRDLLEALQPLSAKPLLARQIPIRDGEKITGFVDVALLADVHTGGATASAWASDIAMLT